jgi:hypothetical protein
MFSHWSLAHGKPSQMTDQWTSSTDLPSVSCSQSPQMQLWSSRLLRWWWLGAWFFQGGCGRFALPQSHFCPSDKCQVKSRRLRVLRTICIFARTRSDRRQILYLRRTKWSGGRDSNSRPPTWKQGYRGLVSNRETAVSIFGQLAGGFVPETTGF